MCVGAVGVGGVGVRGECYFLVLFILVVMNHFYDLYLLYCLSKVINSYWQQKPGIGYHETTQCPISFMALTLKLLFCLRSLMSVYKMGRTFRPN